MKPVTKPPSNLIECRIAHLVYLCERMRDDEIAQYRAMVSGDEFNVDAAVAGFVSLPGIKFTLADDDGTPVCSGGWHEVFPGVWQSWMVGTQDGWNRHWRSITKAARWVMDGLLRTGARRLQTNALASRTQAHEWYERLGLKREGTFYGYGINGEDVALFSRVPETA